MDGSCDEDVKADMKALHGVLRARLHIKLSGKDYGQHRRDLSNACAGSSREHLQDATKANRQLK